MHEHKEAGQTLRHDHAGGELPHGYFEHPEDGSRVTLPELQCSGTVTTSQYVNSISTAEDYARYAAAAMNAASADDTEFIADGATVTAYVHCLAHMSATFTPDEGRPYPGRTS